MFRLARMSVLLSCALLPAVGRAETIASVCAGLPAECAGCQDHHFYPRAPAQRPGGARETVTGEAIAEGLIYARYEVEGVLAHVLKLTLAQKGLRVRSLKADGKETLREMVDRLQAAGERVAGAINGDFFHVDSARGIPFGLQVSDGRLIFGPARRSVIAFGADNKPAIGVVTLKASLRVDGSVRRHTIEGVNTRESDVARSPGIHLYTPEFLDLDTSSLRGVGAVIERVEPALLVGEQCEGEVTRIVAGGERITIPDSGCLVFFAGSNERSLPGVRVGTKLKLDLSMPLVKGKISQAIGGGPRLVRRGRVSVELGKEDFGRLYSLEINRRPAPRSAVGYDRRRQTLFLVVVEGRQRGIPGMRLPELAEFMRKLGCHEAMNFDGGGSAAMWALGKGLVTTSVGGGGAIEERRIANSLLVTVDGPAAGKPESGEVKKPGFGRD